ncbi:hypothetical protein AYI69_g2052 [Smittium culicis]|uniref:Uncharacterized protein n=1 Tax=Smittium culicis TaxID=133412 RepID=A0A1R1YNI8_9FUNG|nr:hypothetical protein AYI69_g2052 [Smittium culicis]
MDNNESRSQNSTSSSWAQAVWRNPNRAKEVDIGVRKTLPRSTNLYKPVSILGMELGTNPKEDTIMCMGGTS